MRRSPSVRDLTLMTNNTTPFTKEFFLKWQPKLLWLANTAMGRKLLCIDPKLPKLIAILPNSVHWEVSTPKRGKQVYGFEYRTHDKYAKVLHHRFYYVWKAMHEFDMNFANHYQPKWNLGFDTFGAFYPDAGTGGTTVDGRVIRHAIDEVFSTIRAGAGTSASDTATSGDFGWLAASATNNQYGRLGRAMLIFDTSSSGAGGTVSSATLSAYGQAVLTELGDSTLDIVSCTLADNNAIVTGDFTGLGTEVFSDQSVSSFSTVAYNDFVLNASGISNIVVDGISSFGARIGWDTDNSFGGSWTSTGRTGGTIYFADQTGTSQDPKLTGTYTLPATGNFFMLF